MMPALFTLQYSRSCSCIVNGILKSRNFESRSLLLEYATLLHYRSLRNENIRTSFLETSKENNREPTPQQDNSNESIPPERLQMIQADLSGIIHNHLVKEKKNKNDDSKSKNHEKYSIRDCLIQILTHFVRSVRNGALEFFLQEQGITMDNDDAVHVKVPHHQFGSACNQECSDLLKKLNVPIEMDRIALVTRNGSYLYNLHTSRSDEDYFIVYFNDLDDKMSLSPSPSTFKRTVDVADGFGSDNLFISFPAV
jgi:hypothetical protein